MLNRVLAEQMTPDQKITVKVVLKLIHGSATYEIIRTQEYKKSYSNKVTSANTVLNIAVKSADGNTRYLKQDVYKRQRLCSVCNETLVYGIAQIRKGAQAQRNRAEG